MKYMGVDWGLKKVGLAVSDGELASSWQSIKIKGLDDGVAKIAALAGQIEAEAVVIGIPEGEMGKMAENALKALRQKGLLVESADETLSSQNARQAMIKLGKGRKARRDDNAAAAAIILQNYLDEKK